MSSVVYIFIDASNVWNAVKSVKKFIEYKTLKDYFRKNFNADKVEIFYYDAYPKAGTRDYDLDGKHKFFTYLKKGLGFTIRKKELKRISVIGESGESIIEKRNMDVEIGRHMLRDFDKNNIDNFILWSGDSDFVDPINQLVNDNKKVFVFATAREVSFELNEIKVPIFEIKKIKEFICWPREIPQDIKDKISNI